VTMRKNNNLMESIAKNKEGLRIIPDCWQRTMMEGYQHLSLKGKGSFGESVVSDLFNLSGSTVESPENTGHDRIIDKRKTEIKFSVAGKDKKTGQPKKDKFMINHLSVGKDWERLVFMGINPEIEEDSVVVWFSHHDFAKPGGIKEKYFKPQQGGKKVANDDWMCSSTDVRNLLLDSMVHSNLEW